MIELYDYQKEAIKKMKNGCILCGDTGSGKSRTAAAYYYQLYGGDLDGHALMKDPADLYIITTARKRDTMEWEHELAPFLIFTHDGKVYNHNVVIDSWNNIKKYKEVKDGFFIFDEQRVVGTGVWTKSFLRITKHNRWILLSATPGDTWMDYLAVFLANGFYNGITDFKQQHVIYNYSGYKSPYPVISGYRNERKLRYLRNSILVPMDFHRETVSHHEHIVTEYDRMFYKNIQRNRWNYWKDRPIENASELCQCLRRVCNSSYERVQEVIGIAVDHKRVLIFYNYDYELELLKEAFTNFVGQDLDGGEDIRFEVAEWNGHYHEPIPTSEYWVYLVQYAAGCEGWNCIETDTMIFYSQNYSYRVMKQASGRIDRANTPFKDLYFYHMKSRSPIDIAITDALKKKKNFNESAFVR